MAKAVDVVTLVAAGETVREACKRAYISATGFNVLVKKEPRLQEMLQEALRFRNEMLADMLVNIDKEVADPRMAGVVSKNIQWVLERNEPDKYGAKLTLQGGGDAASKLLAEALNKAIDRIPPSPMSALPTITDVTFTEVERPASLEELKRLGLI